MPHSRTPRLRSKLIVSERITLTAKRAAPSVTTYSSSSSSFSAAGFAGALARAFATSCLCRCSSLWSSAPRIFDAALWNISSSKLMKKLSSLSAGSGLHGTRSNPVISVGWSK